MSLDVLNKDNIQWYRRTLGNCKKRIHKQAIQLPLREGWMPAL